MIFIRIHENQTSTSYNMAFKKSICIHSTLVVFKSSRKKKNIPVENVNYMYIETNNKCVQLILRETCMLINFLSKENKRIIIILKSNNYIKVTLKNRCC